MSVASHFSHTKGHFSTLHISEILLDCIARYYCMWNYLFVIAFITPPYRSHPQLSYSTIASSLPI